MIEYPQVADKLREEIAKVYKDGSTLTIEELNKMDYLSMVIKETQRISNPAATMLPSTALEDNIVDGVKIKKGTVVSVIFFYS